ncbi:serine/threonine protein kinase, partial [Streptomyces sp. NPDC059083]
MTTPEQPEGTQAVTRTEMTVGPYWPARTEVTTRHAPAGDDDGAGTRPAQRTEPTPRAESPGTEPTAVEPEIPVAPGVPSAEGESRTPTRPSQRTARMTRPRPAVRRLGAGLVPIPAVEPVDPEAAVLDDPVVAEGRRFCWRCGKPVGRASPTQVSTT